MPAEQTDRHRQLLGDVVGIVAGMNDPSCSKSASLSTSIALQPGSEDFLEDNDKLKSEEGSNGGAYWHDRRPTRTPHSLASSPLLIVEISSPNWCMNIREKSNLKDWQEPTCSSSGLDLIKS